MNKGDGCGFWTLMLMVVVFLSAIFLSKELNQLFNWLLQ